MKQLLPALSSRDDYLSRQEDPRLWLPAMRAIGERHGLALDPPIRIGQGTNVVYAAGELIVKLFPPYWQRAYTAELSVSQHVHGQLGVETPQIVAHGALEGWPYLVMTRLRGTYLAEIWQGLAPREQHDLVEQLAALVARLHALPTRGLEALAVDWPSFVEQRKQGCVARHREQGLPEPLLAQLPPFLAAAQPLYPPSFTPAIVSADIHQHHLLARPGPAGWRLSGIFDFDDACLGFHEYDLAASGLFLMHGRRELLRAFMLAYGYPAHALDEALARRLLAYTLLHRYRELRWVTRDLLGGPRWERFDELAQLVYRV